MHNALDFFGWPRLSFPTVTSTTTPMSVLPSWVEVLGRKIDKIGAEMDWGMGVAYLEDIINTIFKKPETLNFFRTVCERFIQLPVLRSHLNLYHMCYSS